MSTVHTNPTQPYTRQHPSSKLSSYFWSLPVKERPQTMSQVSLTSTLSVLCCIFVRYTSSVVELLSPPACLTTCYYLQGVKESHKQILISSNL